MVVLGIGGVFVGIVASSAAIVTGLYFGLDAIMKKCGTR